MKKSIFLFSSILCCTLFFVAFSPLSAANDFTALNLSNGHSGVKSGKVDFVSNDITVEFWVKMEESSMTSPSGFMGNMGSKNNGFLISRRQPSAATGNESTFRFYAKPKTGTNNIDFRIPLAEMAGKWVHVAFVVSSTDGKAYMYINGDARTNPDTYTIANYDVAAGGFLGNANTVNLIFGAWASEPKSFGKVADVRIWSVARTSEQIKANYNRMLSDEQTGLFINYLFDGVDATVLNYGEATDRNATLSSSATWSDCYSYEILSAAPSDLAFDQNVLTWNNTDGTWDVEVYRADDNQKVLTLTCETNTASLVSSSLIHNTQYYAMMQTLNNGFYSDSSTSATFTYIDTASGVEVPAPDELTVTSHNGVVTIHSPTIQTINIHGIDGTIVRTLTAQQGRNIVADLPRGIYLINNKKIVMR